MNSLEVTMLSVFYAVLNASGAALIKSEIAHRKQLLEFHDYLVFLATWRVIVGFLIIAISALVIFKALSMGRFSYVMPIAIGINFCLTVIVGVFLFGDKLSFLSYLALSLILGGILLLSQISR